ncbi:hypothetical protein [Raoultibacter massiliensis]|uniref:hypothetical protein n=1 Tax=Raoultibacter massiliensis TaxID=1852371 RepID=UPI003A9288FF
MSYRSLAVVGRLRRMAHINSLSRIEADGGKDFFIVNTKEPLERGGGAVSDG